MPLRTFPGVMFDPDTLIIPYDPERARSARHARKALTPGAGLGDCIDCGLCVQVCPTGIDIRDGLQMECIACATRIDACDRHGQGRLSARADPYSTEALENTIPARTSSLSPDAAANVDLRRAVAGDHCRDRVGRWRPVFRSSLMSSVTGQRSVERR